jgi:alpha-1,6-mannosyltransferase
MATGVLDSGTIPASTARPARFPLARWALVAVNAVATVALLLSPYGSAADRRAPLTFVACGSLAALVVLELRRPLLRATAVAAVAAALLVAAVAFPPRTSHDVWSYAMYGRITAIHHADPYTAPPARFPADPALQRVDPGWRHARSVYGPVFTGASAVIARVTDRPLLTRLAYQVWAALSVGMVLVLLARTGRSAALAAVGLHPLVIVQVVNGGHNDAFVGLALLAAVWAARRRRPAWVGVAAALAVGTKLVALLPAAVILVWLWRRHGKRSAAVAGMTLLGLTVAGYLAVGGTSAIRPLADAAGYVNRVSMWRLLGIAHSAGVARAALLLTFVIGPAAVLVAARLKADASVAATSGLLVYLLAAPYVMPWYFAWALPLAFVGHDLVVAMVLFVQSILIDLAYATPYRMVGVPDLLDRVMRAVSPITAIFAVIALVLLVGTSSAAVWRQDLHQRLRLRAGARYERPVRPNFRAADDRMTCDQEAA